MPNHLTPGARLARWLATPLKYKINSLKSKAGHLLFQTTTALIATAEQRFAQHPFLRRAYFYAQPANTLLLAHAGGEHYILNASDQAIGRDTFVQRRAYDGDKLSQVVDLLPSEHAKALLVDIGANIGTIGIHAVASGTFQSAIAFEPEPQNFILLKANLALNQLDERIQAHRLALSATAGDVLEFELCDSNHGDHRVRVSSEAGRYDEAGRPVIRVPTATLDSFCDRFHQHSTLIWIDTQGYEGHVFQGGREALRRRVPICMEFWPYGLRRARAFDALLEAFAEAPYEHLIDLRNPEQRLPFSSTLLASLAAELGDLGDWTDLLLL